MIVNKVRHIVDNDSVTKLKSVCPRMSKLIDVVGDIESYYIPDHFQALINGIIYQSISYKAATKIWNRLFDRLSEFTPSEVLEFGYDKIKAVGLSNSKTEYILNIAYAFINKGINTDFTNMSNAEIQHELEQIKGVGPWTSEMFLIFCLYRKDIFSWGDIAIRRGLEYLYDLDHDITKKEFNYYKELYAPSQTIASFYIWEITLRNLFKENI